MPSALPPPAVPQHCAPSSTRSSSCSPAVATQLLLHVYSQQKKRFLSPQQIPFLWFFPFLLSTFTGCPLQFCTNASHASKRFALNSLVSTARRVVAHPGAFLPLLHGVEPNPGSRSRKAVRKWHPGPGLEPNISAQSLALSASSRKSPKSHPTSCSSCLSLVKNPKRCPQHWDAPYWELFSPFALWQGAHVSTQIISSFLCPTAVPSH